MKKTITAIALIGVAPAVAAPTASFAKGRTERVRVIQTIDSFTQQRVVKASDLAAATSDGWQPIVNENARGGRRGGVVRGGGGGQNPVVNGRSRGRRNR